MDWSAGKMKGFCLCVALVGDMFSACLLRWVSAESGFWCGCTWGTNLVWMHVGEKSGVEARGGELAGKNSCWLIEGRKKCTGQEKIVGSTYLDRSRVL